MFYKDLVLYLLIAGSFIYYLFWYQPDTPMNKSDNVVDEIPAVVPPDVPAPLPEVEPSTKLPQKPLEIDVSIYDDLAYSYLNDLRIRAGMTEFSPNQQLESAALNHANYLANSIIIDHDEQEGTSGFSGVNLKDRTTFTGYRSLLVSENFHVGNSNAIESIDSLMSAIYHRFGFLDFVNNEVGIGIVHVSAFNPYSSYVYNMGNSEYNALCEGTAFSGPGNFYSNICEPDINIDAADFNEVAFMAQGNNPQIVLWPADGNNDVPTTFYEEIPDPLPDYSISGYPISIQFNPLIFIEVNVSEFELYREKDNSKIEPTRLLTEHTDPNEKFSALQYALFPLNFLESDTAYRVKVRYNSNLGADTLEWRFQTRSVEVPLFTVKGED